MSTEALMAGGYVAILLVAALTLEWLSVRTNERSQQFRTAGFDYDDQHDFWVCHQGQQLWPEEFDREKRLVRYRAKATVCRACPARESCTDDPAGREITKAIDPWPHSEAGRFHRGISVMLVGLALFILLIELVRHHAPVELAILAPALALTLGLGYWLGRDLLHTPTGFPEVMPAHGNRLKASTGIAADRVAGAGVRNWIEDPEATGPGVKESTGDKSGYLSSGNSPDPDSPAEADSGLPPSRRRQWWEPASESDGFQSPTRQPTPGDSGR